MTIEWQHTIENYRGVDIVEVKMGPPVGHHYDARYPGFGKITDKTLAGIKRTIDLLETGYRPGGV